MTAYRLLATTTEDTYFDALFGSLESAMEKAESMWLWEQTFLDGNPEWGFNEAERSHFIVELSNDRGWVTFAVNEIDSDATIVSPIVTNNFDEVMREDDEDY